MPKPKSRGNKQGSVYQDPKTKLWTAQAVVGWVYPKDPSKPRYPKKKTKSGFKHKYEAVAYLPTLKSLPDKPPEITLNNVYRDWSEIYAPRVDASTMDCYKYAYKHFLPLHNTYISRISANDLQECMDKCTAGKRTHENMKCVAGLLWAYAMDCNYVEKNVSANLYIGKHTTRKREPLTEKEIATIRDAIGKIRYAEYVYTLCYLGFRPGEFLSLKKSSLITIEDIDILVGGGKTEAGRNRKVVIPPQVLDYVKERLFIPGTDLLFPQYCFRRSKDEFTGFKEMSDAYFREEVFKPMMKQLNIAEGKVPYSARHSFSDKLKKAEGSDKAKAQAMGHTDYNFTKSKYQSTDLEEMIEVAVSIE